jgi:hypothetical protein
MIFRPSDEFNKAVNSLLDDGFHLATEQELPQDLRKRAGAETFLVNAHGCVVSVNQGSGEVRQVTPTPSGP